MQSPWSWGSPFVLESIVFDQTVVFVVCHHVPDVDAAEVVTAVDDEAVFITADIEHDFSPSDEVGRWEILLDVEVLRIALAAHDARPIAQLLRGVLVAS